ncbi:MAG: hypothetical protein ACPLXM_02725 [Bacteroidales bacterium]
MRIIAGILIVAGLTMIPSSFSLKRIDYSESRNKNVCKFLKGDVLLYFVFVDNKESAPWTEFDIQTTLDSIAMAVKWLHRQATTAGVPLRIKTDYYIGKEYSTISRNLTYGTVSKTFDKLGLRKGLEELNTWGDNIAKRVGSAYVMPEKDGIPEIKNPRNKERLVAFLRDDHAVESVALLYLLNNYFRIDISVQVNTFDTNDVEFAIVSYKYPSEIAHNFLHLFGAADLYKTPFRRSERKIRLAQKEFPDDIMQDPYGRSIENMTIGPLTRYLIGWTDSLDPSFNELLTDRTY